MAAYRRVYDLRHHQVDCQEPGSAPKPYAQWLSMGYLYLFYINKHDDLTWYKNQVTGWVKSSRFLLMTGTQHQCKQGTLFPQTDRAMCYVGWNLINCCTTVWTICTTNPDQVKVMELEHCCHRRRVINYARPATTLRQMEGSLHAKKTSLIFPVILIKYQLGWTETGEQTDT